MAKYKIAWLPGDGIGVDVMEAARIVLDKLALDADYFPGEIGWHFWCTEGNALPQRTIDLLHQTDCCVFGAITSKPKEEAQQELNPSLRSRGFKYESPIVRLRQEFNLRTNLRPCRAYPGNPLNYRDDIDLVVFRENTEDLYSGVEFHPLPREVMDVIIKHNARMSRFEKVPVQDIAVTLRVITRNAARNIIRDAFEYAKKNGYITVTIIEKPNVTRETSGLMIKEARAVASEYPAIELWEVNIDAMCMWLLKNPQHYGVLVTSNMFGDIISDLCAQLVGGLGFAPSGNIGDDYAVFEPTHGSAPKYAGLYKANPMAMFLAIKLMLDYLGETKKSLQLEKAIRAVIDEGKCRTYDMGGTSSTLDMAHAVNQKLEILGSEKSIQELL